MQNSGLVDRTIKATEEYAKAQERENAEIGTLDERMSSLTSEINSITGGTGAGGGAGSGGRNRRRSNRSNVNDRSISKRKI